ncbi:MAG: diaminopimelate decarboxylase, partial [Prevotella sp.]|nr:diaminopimelate decarboxylase [Prevotella sp.]
MIKQLPTDKFQAMRTPFYYYDTALLKETLRAIKAEAGRHDGFIVHYAVKA